MDQMRTYLPWSPEELEMLLLDLVRQGFEGSKVDFKKEMPVSNAAQKADFLKDTLAFVNTRDEHYHDYGFLIYGVEGGEIVGVPPSHPSGETFQTHLENLIRQYISPFVPISVMSFDHEGKNWGVVMTPPSNNRPHLIFKDYVVAHGQGDPNKSLARGQWFVRRGSTTDVAGPEDYARILRETIVGTIGPLEDSLKSLRVFYESLDSKVDSLLSRQQVSTPRIPTQTLDDDLRQNGEFGETVKLDLPSRFQQKLRGPDDPLLTDLLGEASELQAWLEAGDSDLPWNFGQGTPQPEELQAIITLVEGKTETLLKSLAVILANDDKSRFDNTVLMVVKLLAKEGGAPPHTAYNRNLDYLRKYPLTLVMYTLFVFGVHYNRSKLLKKVLVVPYRQRYERSPETIIQGIWSVHRAGDMFNQALQSRQCDPVKSRLFNYFKLNLLPLIPYEEEEKVFFEGEFILALAALDRPTSEYPWPGLYVYFRSATTYLTEFLQKPPDWFGSFYNTPVEELFQRFDDNARRVVSANCFGEGFVSGALAAYQNHDS